MMEKEISETYYYTSADFDNQGRRLSNSMTLKDVIKDFERAFHKVHTTEYALNLYANSQTMALLAKYSYGNSIWLYWWDKDKYQVGLCCAKERGKNAA